MTQTKKIVSRLVIPLALILSGIIVLATVVKYGALWTLTDPKSVVGNGSPFDREMFYHFYNWLIRLNPAFWAHISFGSFALLTGTIQIARILKKRTGRFHRLIGTIYAISVPLSAIGGFFMALEAMGGWIASLGFATASLLWLITLIPAIIHAIRNNLKKHAFWIKINFALTFASVTLRLEMPLLYGLGVDHETAYQIVSWLCWVPNLIFALLHVTGSTRIFGILKIQNTMTETAMRSREKGMTGLFLILFTLAFSLVADRPSAAPSNPQAINGAGARLDGLKAELRAEIREIMDDDDIHGLSIALVDREGFVWTEGFGHADEEERLPVTAETAFSIASVTKLFTALAVMRLHERGELDIDRPLRTYLPEFRIRNPFPNSGEPTIRQILTHHSGLPSDFLKDFIYGTTPRAEGELTPNDIPALLEPYSLATPPGESYSYSNLGYELLGVLVERVSGMPFEDYMRREILLPVGMEKSSLRPEDLPANDISKGFFNGTAMNLPRIRSVGAGAMVSTATDMAAFMTTVLKNGEGAKGSVVSSATLREMARVQNEENPFDGGFRIGLGFWHYAKGYMTGEDPLLHGGDLSPFHSVCIMFPGSGIGITILYNTEGGNIARFYELAETVLRRAHLLKTGRALPLGNPVIGEKIAPERLIGTYATPMGVVRIERSGDDLALKLPALRHLPIRLRLRKERDGLWRTEARLFSLIPIGSSLTRIISFAPHGSANSTMIGMQMGPIVPFGTFSKIEPVPVPSAWMKREGHYRILNPGRYPFISSARLEYDRKDGFFKMTVKFSKIMGGTVASFPLSFSSDERATLMGRGRNLGETISVTEREGVEILLCFGYELVRE